MAALELHVTARGVESSEGGAEKEKEKDVVATRSGGGWAQVMYEWQMPMFVDVVEKERGRMW